MIFEDNKIYYIRMVNGDNIVSEIITERFHERIVYILRNPMIMRLLPGQRGRKSAIMAVPFTEPSLLTNQEFILNPDSVLYHTENISEEMYSVYEGFLNYIMELQENPPEYEEGGLVMTENEAIDLINENSFEEDDFLDEMENFMNPEKTNGPTYH